MHQQPRPLEGAEHFIEEVTSVIERLERLSGNYPEMPAVSVYRSILLDQSAGNITHNSGRPALQWTARTSMPMQAHEITNVIASWPRLVTPAPGTAVDNAKPMLTHAAQQIQRKQNSDHACRACRATVESGRRSSVASASRFSDQPFNACKCHTIPSFPTHRVANRFPPLRPA